MDLWHTSFFYMISINFNSAVLIWILYWQPFLYFFKDLVIIPKTIPTNYVFWGPQGAGNLRKQDQSLRCAGTNSLSEFCDCFLLFQLACRQALEWWSRISTTFSWDRTLLKCFRKVLRVSKYRYKLKVWTFGIIFTTLTPHTLQKQWPERTVSLGST
jgi:hypothetical protein